MFFEQGISSSIVVRERGVEGGQNANSNAHVKEYDLNVQNMYSKAHIKCQNDAESKTQGGSSSWPKHLFYCARQSY